MNFSKILIQQYLIPVKYQRKHRYIFQSLALQFRPRVHCCLGFIEPHQNSADTESRLNRRKFRFRFIKRILTCCQFFETLVRSSSQYKISQFSEILNNHNLIIEMVAINCKLNKFSISLLIGEPIRQAYLKLA